MVLASEHDPGHVGYFAGYGDHHYNNILLVSREDGRQNLVNVTRQLSRAVRDKELPPSSITPEYVDSILQGVLSCMWSNFTVM